MRGKRARATRRSAKTVKRCRKRGALPREEGGEKKRKKKKADPTKHGALSKVRKGTRRERTGKPGNGKGERIGSGGAAGFGTRRGRWGERRVKGEKGRGERDERDKERQCKGKRAMRGRKRWDPPQHARGRNRKPAPERVFDFDVFVFDDEREEKGSNGSLFASAPRSLLVFLFVSSPFRSHSASPITTRGSLLLRPIALRRVRSR